MYLFFIRTYIYIYIPVCEHVQTYHNIHIIYIVACDFFWAPHVFFCELHRPGLDKHSETVPSENSNKSILQARWTSINGRWLLPDGSRGWARKRRITWQATRQATRQAWDWQHQLVIGCLIFCRCEYRLPQQHHQVVNTPALMAIAWVCRELRRVFSGLVNTVMLPTFRKFALTWNC